MTAASPDERGPEGGPSVDSEFLLPAHGEEECGNWTGGGTLSADPTPHTAEPKLGRKASTPRRGRQLPTVVEGTVQKRRDEDLPADAPPSVHDGNVHEGDGDPESAGVSEAKAVNARKPVSPARARAADQTVKRATGGLIRLDGRRRMRSFLRRALYVALVIAPLAGLVCWFAEDIVDLLVAYWERIEAKLPPAEASEAPRR